MAKKPWKDDLTTIEESLNTLINRSVLSHQRTKTLWINISKSVSLIPKAIRNEYGFVPWAELLKIKKLSEVKKTDELNEQIAKLTAQIPALADSLNPLFTRANTPIHAWKICPPGEIYIHKTTVTEHMRANHLVKEHLRRDHCRNIGNYGFHNVLTPQEVRDISEIYFNSLDGAPEADAFEFHEKGNQYDHLIRGWTKYWNDVLQPSDPLDPNMVKALIASESSFNPKEHNKRGNARGLMQIMPDSIKALNGYRNELKDHIFEFDTKDIFDPNLNIAAGIRWLFHKKNFATRKLKRDATWNEAIEEFKGVLIRRLNNKKYDKNILNRFLTYLRNLKEQK